MLCHVFKNSGSSKLMRVFVCAKLPQASVDALLRWISLRRTVCRGVRWVLPDTLHITLKFCGEIERETVDAMCAQLAKEELGRAFSLAVSGVGGFPSLAAPRVIWAGIKGETKELRRLQRIVDSCASGFGMKKDEKFSPHITLGRRREASPLDAASVAALGNDVIELPEWTVGEIIMMESTLTRGGPLYTPIECFSLKK